MEKRDYWNREFRRLVILGESTVEGGGWLPAASDRYSDVLVRLINHVQSQPIEYHNAGIGASVISPNSPGYDASAKPSAMERYESEVIARKPDLFVMAYGLNDMRAGMDPQAFARDLDALTSHVRRAVGELTILFVNVYHMSRYDWYPPFDRGSVEATQIYNGVIHNVAEKVDGLVADVWGAQGMADWLVHPDSVHANRVGNIVIANRIFETLANNCSGLCLATREADRDTEWARATAGARENSVEPVEE